MSGRARSFTPGQMIAVAIGEDRLHRIDADPELAGNLVTVVAPGDREQDQAAITIATATLGDRTDTAAAVSRSGPTWATRSRRRV